MKIKTYTDTIGLPDGVTASVAKGVLTLKKGATEISRNLFSKQVSLAVKDTAVIVSFKDGNKRHKCIAGTLSAHIRNMIKGVTEGHVYKLKVCASHFPMSVTIKGNKFSVANFLGEKIPREMTIKPGATTKIEGDIITVESNLMEVAAQVAADIEQLMKVSNRDRRIFQDGIYITEKDGKHVE